jgi:hypothetical protein
LTHPYYVKGWVKLDADSWAKFEADPQFQERTGIADLVGLSRELLIDGVRGLPTYKIFRTSHLSSDRW